MNKENDNIDKEEKEEKTSPETEDSKEEKTEDHNTPEEKEEAPQEESDDDADGEEKVIPPAPDKTSAAKAAADLNEAARQQLRLDKTYKAGKLVYKIGLVILVLLMAANAAMYFLNIEIFINGAYCTWMTFYLYVIPCAVMLTGLILSAKTAKKHGLNDNDGLGIAFVSIGAALMIALGTVQMIAPSYRIYETQDVSIRDGEPMKIVKYIPTGIFEPKLKKLPGEYCMDIYRVDGIFCRKIFSKTVSYSSYVIYPDESNSGGYIFGIASMDNEEVIPFSYN